MKRMMIGCLAALAMVGCSGATAPKEPAGESAQGTSVLDLRISPDGTAIVDAQGNPIAHFVEGMKVRLATTTKSAEATIPGCMCCKDECIAWDSNGKCIKTYRSCTWDFDCGCK